MSKTELFKELDKLTSLDYLSEEQKNFYLDLHFLQSSAKRRFKKILPNLSKINVKERLNQGLPVLNFTDLRIEKDLILELIEGVLNLIEKYNKDKSISLSAFIETIKQKEFDCQEFIIKSISLDYDYFSLLSERTAIDRFSLFFIGVNAIKPFMELIALDFKEKIENIGWLKNFCPVCSGKPRMAKLSRQDGRRILQCYICNTQWLFPRTKCHYCGNEDFSTLRFFCTEEDSPYRVDICDECKHYLKTVDERKTPKDKKIDLAIEDIVTSHLDLLAGEEGYFRFFDEQNLKSVCRQTG